MRLSHLLSAFLVACGLSVAGCGGSNEPTSIDSGELQSYVQENADALAAEDAEMEAEDAAEDADDE
jgi:hypothetical protein